MIKSKRISIVVNGRFHAFDYAAELQKIGRLQCLISTMPYSKARGYEICRENYVGLCAFELLKRASLRVFKKYPVPHLFCKAFARAATRYIDPSQHTVIAFAGVALEAFKTRSTVGHLKILDRGSTHALENIRLRKEAAQYHGVSFSPHSPRFVRRELEEYQAADKILIPSTFVENTFLSCGVEGARLWKIPYATSESRMRFQGRRVRFGGTILFVGTVGSRKGIKVVVDAVSEVRKRLPWVRLRVVGPLSKESSDFAFLNQPWIEITGPLRGDELVGAYLSASLFTLGSYEEGLALVLTEALGCGLPIVATENTGVKDIAEKSEACVAVPSGSPEEMARSIHQILADQNRWEEMSNAAMRVSLGYTWKDFVSRLCVLIDGLPY